MPRSHSLAPPRPLRQSEGYDKPPTDPSEPSTAALQATKPNSAHSQPILQPYERFFRPFLVVLQSVCYICIEFSANLSELTVSNMAKARVSINPLYKGGAGGYTFYVREGEQVLRQRKNNSNYGESASRTLAQMYRRIRWGNLVNTFKAMKAWQPKAYDSKTAGQTDYNIFVSLNINSATVGSTKGMNQAGAAVWQAFQVSRGSLPPIANGLSSGNSQFITDVKLSITITGSTTIGQLSADIIANNPQFLAGDNLALITFRNWTPAGGRFPYAASVYQEITLDAANTNPLTSIPTIGSRIVKTSGNVLGISTTSLPVDDSAHEVGFVAIHARQSASTLQVSSQSIVMLDEQFINQYSGSEWDLFCIESYGQTEDVPLNPSFKRASVSLITANGSAIVPGSVLEDQQVIQVFGENLYAPQFRFVFDGVEYTPLAFGDGYVEFTLTQAGTAQVYVNGSVYLSFDVENVAPPVELSGQVIGYLVPNVGSVGGYAAVRSSSNYCINFNEMVTDDLKGFRIVVSHEIGSVPAFEDFEGVNCALSAFAVSESQPTVVFGITPTDPAAVCYVTYKGFIIFVGNYN